MCVCHNKKLLGVRVVFEKVPILQQKRMPTIIAVLFDERLGLCV